MGSALTVRAGSRTVRVHRPDKVLFPDDGYTKADLVAHYRAVAPYLLPHLRGRPLMLERYPDGLDGPRLVQKETPGHYPDWVDRVTVDKKEGGTVTHTVCDTTATLVHLADQATITPHRGQSRTGRLDRPDRLVFDLDPPGDAFEPVRRAALLLLELLDELRLPGAPMTTGSRGLHVVVPVDGRDDFDRVRSFAKDVADTLAAAHPDAFTTAARKADRGDHLYLDVQRNAYAQTAVAPWAVRARPGAPVAAPLAREQLDDPELHARRWTIADALEQARTDPWRDLPRKGRALAPARRRLAGVRGES